MSVNTTPPVSLKEIQYNFSKSGRVGSDDRYVIDFAQRDGVTWDLLDYAGQAYGLQHKIFNDGWNGGDSAGDLPLDQSDKRVDGSVSGLDEVGRWGSYVELGTDASGKYAEISCYQSYSQSNPGSVAMNGVWYADEAGTSNPYRLRATVETADDFTNRGEAGIFVFGYRYGYLDGDRLPYVLWGNGSTPGAGQTLTCDVTFNVNTNYRHIVVNVNSFLSGRYGEYERGAFKVRDLTIERV